MATLTQVKATMELQHPTSGVVVVDGSGGQMKALATRPPINGGAAVLVVLDFDPEAHGMTPATVANL
jgi:hypothetical protein